MATSRDQAVLEDILTEAVDVALYKGRDRYDQHVEHCQCCDDVDGHRDGCPVPVIQEWLKKGERAHA